MLVVHRDQREAIPRALLDGDLGPERLDEAVAVPRSEAAELDVGALAADRGNLGRGRRYENGTVTVEVGLALVPVVGVPLSDPVRAFHVLDELERSGAHHVRLVPVHVLGQEVRIEDPVVGRGQADQKRCFGPLEAEPHGMRVGRLDGLDDVVGTLAHGDQPGGREDDLVVAGLHVPRRHEAAVVEVHALAEPEGVGRAVW